MSEKIPAIAKFEDFLANYEGEDRIISSHEAKKLLEEMSQREFKFFSKLPTLDRLLDGFETGELIVVSGPTKAGKTLFCQTLTRNFEIDGKKCLWFSYELPIRQFISRFPTLPLFYLPKHLAGRNCLWLERKIWEAKLKYECSIVFIDHLGFLNDNENVGNKRVEIDTIVRKVKTIAIKHNILIFLLWHNRRPPMLRSQRYEQTEDDLKESSGVAQDSDAVLMIRRIPVKNGREEDWNTGRGRVDISISRRSGVMRKGFGVQLTNGFFEEVAEEYKEENEETEIWNN